MCVCSSQYIAETLGNSAKNAGVGIYTDRSHRRTGRFSPCISSSWPFRRVRAKVVELSFYVADSRLDEGHLIASVEYL